MTPMQPIRYPQHRVAWMEEQDDAFAGPGWANPTIFSDNSVCVQCCTVFINPTVEELWQHREECLPFTSLSDLRKAWGEKRHAQLKELDG